MLKIKDNVDLKELEKYGEILNHLTKDIPILVTSDEVKKALVNELGWNNE